MFYARRPKHLAKYSLSLKLALLFLTGCLALPEYHLVNARRGAGQHRFMYSTLAQTPLPGVNVALASNGGIATASSTFSNNYPPSGANNGDRKAGWEAGGGWNDATVGEYPDWIEVAFSGTKTINEIDVFTLQDDYNNAVEPTLAQTFSLYGITHFDVQYWTGSTWASVPGGSVTNNNRVWSQFTFSDITTSKIRVQVNQSRADYSRVVEIEAYQSTGAPPGQPTHADTVRFLEQSTFGPSTATIAHVQNIGFGNFLDEQFNAPASSYPTLPLYPTTRDPNTCPDNSTCPRDNYSMYPLQNRFFVNALYGPDQLRQRVAFALHQIFVVSGRDVTLPGWMAPYLQTLDRNAFGNYRQLLYEITLNPAMGNYLDMAGNTRSNPNENYAREILQLFSIGTVKLNLDGTPQRDAQGQPIPAYDQTTVNNFARVFTGWNRAAAPSPGVPNYIDPMIPTQSQHDTGTKTLLRGVQLPAGRTATQDLNDALDNIFNDPNVGPFISKQLIQHLVTSNPSSAYVSRVAAVFNDNGAGARGDLRAVVQTILLDEEARGDLKTDPNYGHLRQPALFITNVLRAFNARSADGSANSDGYLNPQGVLMSMDVFRPPSVFSYYPPGYVVPGTNGARGPEFGILSTSTALKRINFVNTIVFSNIPVSANAPNGTSINLSAMQALAGNPAQLVDELNRLMMHGTMSAEMRGSIIGAVSAVSGSNPLKRARTAVYLVATSSQYQVGR